MKCSLKKHYFNEKNIRGGFRGLNPGPLAPKARIMPLDQIPAIQN